MTTNNSLYGRDLYYHNSTLNDDEEQTYRSMHEYNVAMVLWKYFAPAILLVGTIGSVVSLLVLCQKSMRKQTTMFYLAVLAVADGCVLYVGLLRLWLEKRFDFFIRLESDWACRLHTFGAYVCLDFSVWILVAVSVDRCLFISLPYSAKRWCTLNRARIAVVVIVLCLIIVNIHFLWTYRRESDEAASVFGNENYRCYVNTDSYVSQRFIKSVWPWLDFCVYCLTPFVIMLVTNVVIVRHLINSDRRMAAHRHMALSRPPCSSSKNTAKTKNPKIANADKVAPCLESSREKKENSASSTAGAGDNVESQTASETIICCRGNNRRLLQPVSFRIKGGKDDIEQSSQKHDAGTGRPAPVQEERWVGVGVGRRSFARGVRKALKFLRPSRRPVVVRHLDDAVEQSSASDEARSPRSKGKRATIPPTATRAEQETNDSLELESVSTVSDSNPTSGRAKDVLTQDANTNRNHISLLKGFGFKGTNKIHPMKTPENLDNGELGNSVPGEELYNNEAQNRNGLNTENSLTCRQGEKEAQIASICTSNDQRNGSKKIMDKNRELKNDQNNCLRAMQDSSNKTSFQQTEDISQYQTENINKHSGRDAKQIEMLHLDSGHLTSTESEIRSFSPQEEGISTHHASSHVTKDTNTTSSTEGTSAFTLYAKPSSLANAVVSSTCALFDNGIGSDVFETDDTQTNQDVQFKELIVSTGFLSRGSSHRQSHHQNPSSYQRNPTLFPNPSEPNNQSSTSNRSKSQSPNFCQQNPQSPNSNQFNRHDNAQSRNASQLNTRCPSSNQPKSHFPNSNQPEIQSPYSTQTDTQSQNSNQPKSHFPNSNQPEIQSPYSTQTDTQSQNSNQPKSHFPNSNQPTNTDSPNANSTNSSSGQPDTHQSPIPMVSRPKKVILTTTSPDLENGTSQNRFIKKTPAGHRRMKTSQAPRCNNLKTTSVSTTLLAVNVLFWLLNAPIMIYIIGFTYWIRDADGYRLAKLELAWAIANILQYSNNAAHIFLYCLTGPRFRKELWSLLRRKK